MLKWHCDTFDRRRSSFVLTFVHYISSSKKVIKKRGSVGTKKIIEERVMYNNMKVPIEALSEVLSDFIRSCVRDMISTQ